MAFLDKTGLQTLTNKLVQGDAIKVASHRGKNVKEVIDNIQRECENVALPNTMTLENRINGFKVGQGRDVDVSGDVEEGKIEVEFQGKTYQNLVKENQIYVKELKTTNHTGFLLPKYDLKSNTIYTIMFTVSNLVKDGNSKVYSIFRGNNNDNSFIQFDALYVEKNGLFAQKFTLANGLKNFLIGVSGSSNKNNPSFTIGDIMILEGDYTQTPIEELPKYFEGIQSSFENRVVDIEVQGKNLLNIKHKTLEAHGLIIEANEEKQQFIVNGSATGDVYVYFCGETWKSELNDSITNTNYSLTILTDGDVDVKSDRKDLLHVQMGYKDENNVSKSYFDRRVTQLGEVKCGLFKTGDYRITSPWFRLDKGNVYKNFVIKLQIEHQASTSYEPYYKKKISFNIGEPLRSLPNGICDEIRNNNGQWELIRRTGCTQVDGINTYFASCYNTDSKTNVYEATLRLTNVKKSSIAICNKYSNIVNYNLDSEHFYTYSSGDMVFFINKNKIDNQTGVNLTEKANNLVKIEPIEIIYELAKPIITPIEPIEFNTSQGAIINISSDISPTSTHKVILNRAGQIEQGIELIANLKSRVNELENIYDSNLIATQYKLDNLKLNYELEREED